MYDAVYPTGMQEKVATYAKEKNKFNKTEKQVHQWHIPEHIPGYKNQDKYIQGYQEKAGGINIASSGLDYMSNSVNKY